MKIEFCLVISVNKKPEYKANLLLFKIPKIIKSIPKINIKSFIIVGHAIKYRKRYGLKIKNDIKKKIWKSFNLKLLIIFKNIIKDKIEKIIIKTLNKKYKSRLNNLLINPIEAGIIKRQTL